MSIKESVPSCDVMIEMDSVDFRYAESGFRFHLPSLSVVKGAQVAVVGPSGSGKTTLLELVCGLLMPSAGRISVGGVAVAELDDAKRRRLRRDRMGIVFQDLELIDYLSVRDNLLFPVYLSSNRWQTAPLVVRAAEVGEHLGLGEKMSRRVTELSRGERQRVAIGRALMCRPGLILADEPTSHLDEPTAKSVGEFLRHEAKAMQSTLIVATHNRSWADEFDFAVDLGPITTPAEQLPA